MLLSILSAFGISFLRTFLGSRHEPFRQVSEPNDKFYVTAKHIADNMFNRMCQNQRDEYVEEDGDNSPEPVMRALPKLSEYPELGTDIGPLALLRDVE